MQEEDARGNLQFYTVGYKVPESKVVYPGIVKKAGTASSFHDILYPHVILTLPL